MADTWQDAPIVEVELPSCPACGCVAYIGIRGWKDSDGGRTSRRVCKRCSRRYIVLTVPRSGKPLVDTPYDETKGETSCVHTYPKAS